MNYLRELIAKHDAERRPMTHALLDACDEVDRLRAELAEAKLDSARLDWLEKQKTPWADHEGLVPGGAMCSIEFDWFAELDFRAAIDAARAQSGAPERKEGT